MKSIFIVVAFPSLDKALVFKPVFSPQSLLKLRGDVVCQALHSTILSAPASGLCFGPQSFGYGMAFFRVDIKLSKEWREKRKNQNPEQESAEGGGCILANAMLQGLQDWVSWTWITLGNQPLDNEWGITVTQGLRVEPVPVSDWVLRLVWDRFTSGANQRCSWLWCSVSTAR